MTAQLEKEIEKAFDNGFVLPFFELSENEKEIARFAFSRGRKSMLKEIEEGTFKVFGDGTKGPWSTMLDIAKKDARKQALEDAAKVADRYDYGKADEHIPDDKIEAFNSGCEDAKEDIASSIRALKGEGE